MGMEGHWKFNYRDRIERSGHRKSIFVGCGTISEGHWWSWVSFQRNMITLVVVRLSLGFCRDNRGLPMCALSVTLKSVTSIQGIEGIGGILAALKMVDDWYKMVRKYSRKNCSDAHFLKAIL